MKKNKGILGFAVVLLVVLLGSLIYNTVQKSSQKTTNTQQVAQTTTQDKKVKLGVLQLLSHPALDAIYQGIQDELAKEGYEAGKNLEIDFQNAQGDQSNLASMSEKLVSNKNDVIVGITTPATLSLANVTKDIPIVMGGITYPVEAGLIKDEKKPGNNITGVSDRTPIKQQLEIMKQVVPTLKTVGILYTSSEDNSVKQAKQAEEDAKALGIKNNELVWISSSRGKVISRADVSSRTNKGACYMTYQWWIGKCNELTAEHLNPGSRTPEYKYSAVRIEKIEDQRWAEHYVVTEYTKLKSRLKETALVA